MAKVLNGKSYVGNPHVAPSQRYGGTSRFDEGEVALAATPRRGSLLYRTKHGIMAAIAAFAATVAAVPLSVYAALPDGYAQLDWVESDGTAYINTGVVPTQTMEFTFKFQPETQQAWKGAFGSYVDEPSLSTRIIFSNTSSTSFRVYHLSRANSGGVIFDNVVSGLGQPIEGYFNHSYARLNNVEHSLSAVTGTATSEPMKLGRSSGAGTSRQKIFYFKITEGSTLLRDFVPARRKSDSAIGFYDRANSVFYGNAEASGAFTAGPSLDGKLIVSGEPVAYGIPSPGYGTHDEIGAGDSFDVSCPAAYTNYTTATIWYCTGWTLYDVDDTVISSGAGNSFAYTHPNPAAYRRLEWQWEASAYCGTTAAGHGGTVSPSGAEWYAVDTPVTVTATPNAGSSFRRWNGTLPAGIDATSPSVTFTPTAPFDMTALFVSGDLFTWTGEGDTAAWSDGGNWEGGTAPGSGDTAVILAGSTAKWSQTDASFMNALGGIELNGDMEVSNMTAATTLTVPLSGSGVFRGLYGTESAPSLSSGTYYYLTLQNDNRGFTGTFAFTNCGVCVNHNLALGSASTRCTLRWRNGTSNNHRRLYFMSAGPHNANMFLSQPNYSHGMIFATCDDPTYLDGDIDLTGQVQFHANARAKGLHIRGKLTNSGKAAYNLEPYVYLEGEVNLQYNSQSQFGNGFYLGGGNGNIKNMGHIFVGGSGIHFSAPNVFGGSDLGGMCYNIRGNTSSLVLYLDGNDQNWYRQPSAQGFIVDSTSPATLRMMNFGNANQTYNTANCLQNYASFDVCATNKSGTTYTTTVTTTHCTTRGGLLCGAGTFVVGNSAAASATTSFSNLTSLVTYNAGTMKIYNTAINPVNGITNLSVLGTSAMTLGDGVSFNAVQANLSSAASLTVPAGSTIRVSDHTYLDGAELRAGVYGKVGGTYEDGSAIPAAFQLSCLKGDGWLDTNGRRNGFILSFR